MDDAGLPGHLANLGSKVDQTALGWPVRDRDELDPFVDHGAHSRRQRLADTCSAMLRRHGEARKGTG